MSKVRYLIEKCDRLAKEWDELGIVAQGRYGDEYADQFLDLCRMLIEEINRKDFNE